MQKLVSRNTVSPHGSTVTSKFRARLSAEDLVAIGSETVSSSSIPADFARHLETSGRKRTADMFLAVDD